MLVQVSARVVRAPHAGRVVVEVDGGRSRYPRERGLRSHLQPGGFTSVHVPGALRQMPEPSVIARITGEPPTRFTASPVGRVAPRRAETLVRPGDRRKRRVRVRRDLAGVGRELTGREVDRARRRRRVEGDAERVEHLGGGRVPDHRDAAVARGDEPPVRRSDVDAAGHVGIGRDPTDHRRPEASDHRVPVGARVGRATDAGAARDQDPLRGNSRPEPNRDRARSASSGSPNPRTSPARCRRATMSAPSGHLPVVCIVAPDSRLAHDAPASLETITELVPLNCPPTYRTVWPHAS